MTQISYEYGLPPSSTSRYIAAEGMENVSSNQNDHVHSNPHLGGGGTVAARKKPLEKSRLSVVGKSMNPKKYPPQSAVDNTEFYTNIWTAPPTTAGRNKESVHKFVDISQVAYVVTTTLDFKEGYEATSDFELVNIWTMEPYSVSSTNSMSVEAANSDRGYLSNLTNISEDAEEDDDMRTTQLSSSMEPAPLSNSQQERSASYRNNSRRLRKGISEEDLEMVVSVPVRPPLVRGNSAVFSPVLAVNNEVNRSWQARFLLGIHEPVRHALFVIDRFLERIQRLRSPTEWNVNEFFVWFKTHFVEFVKNQHDVKIKVLIPLLRVDANVKREIVLCYDRIFQALDTIVAQEDCIVFSAASASSSWQDNLFVLQSDIRKINLLINSILTAEEKILDPLLARTFSEPNFQRYVVPRIFRASKPKRVVIPWIIERCRIWGGDRAAQAYKDELPFTARFLYDRMWLPYFVSHVAQSMRHLDTEMTGMVADTSDSWFTCTIQ